MQKMRGPTPEENSTVVPSDLRAHTKTTQAYLDIRKKILTGEIPIGQTIAPREIDEIYNTSTQIVLLRLAGEGLIKVRPMKAHVGANNAAINEYVVADFHVRHRMLSTRHGDFVYDISQRERQASIETKILKIQYADQEVASLLEIHEGEKLIFRRTYQYQNSETLVAVSDAYLPFWMVHVLPELEKQDADVHALMKQMEKKPFWCTETVDVVQSTPFERHIFDLSSDDPSPLLKIQRRVFDEEGHPLLLDFLTDRGDVYRLHYSFPLFRSDVPENIREK
jgi:hypothetical protein